jgi:D-galactarolactone cycloisomerase
MADLKIRSIETIPVQVELNRTYKGSYYKMPKRCTIITRVQTEEGIVGESYNADSYEEQPEILSMIQDELEPLVQGRDAFASEDCWEAMLPITFDQLRDRRLAMQAIACVDSAIWDAIGKALGEPLYRLWGGYREAVPMIGIGGYYGGEPDGIERDVEYFRGQGMVGMKFKVGARPPEEDADRLRRAVTAAGPGFQFVVDANQGYTLADAIRFSRLASEFVELRWFEEPCRWFNDRRAMRDVRLATGIPVAAGQSEISRAGMRDLMMDGAIDVSNFDASWGGGPTEWRRVASLAVAFGVQMAHHEEAQVASHLLASVPHSTFVEAFHPDRDPIFWQMLGNRPELVDGGLFPLPDKPGFGWELDEDFIERHRVDR